MKSDMLRNATILLVDDDPTNLAVLSDYLENTNLTIMVARSGEQALEQIEYELPDLIMLDVMMPPGIDGFETCRRLKAAERTRAIPVIFITALTDAEYKIQGFDVGGVDYVTKPFEEREILARIKAHLTIRKQYQYIERQNQELHDLNANKDKFFSIIAHDLRSSLTGFLSFAALIEDIERLEKDEFMTLTRQFHDSARNLMALLENLLTWSRLQRDLLTWAPEKTPLHTVITRNIELFTPQAAAKHISITTTMPPPLFVEADPYMLNAVVRNLLSNAIKFTPSGGTVEVAATRNAHEVSVTVSDTGVGIAADKLPHVFQIGAKTKREGTEGEKGTGLGLILCKEFIDRHGGRIWVESEINKGARVNFTLPEMNVQGIDMRS